MRHLFLLSVIFLVCNLAFGQTTADIDTPISLPFLLQSDSIPVYGYEVINSFPHDPDAFTQGLVYEEPDYLYEGTGMWQNSDLRKVKLESGNVEQKRPLNNEVGENYFGEGVTTWG